MKHVILHQDEFVGGWVCRQNGGVWEGRGVAIGLGDGDKLIAGVLFDSYNGASCQVHLASDGSRQWMNKEFLWLAFALPFIQWKLNMLIGPVAETNLASRSFCERMGFVLGATLEDAHPNGALLLYTMKRSACPWLNIKLRKRYGWEEQRAGSTGLREISPAAGC